MKIPDKTAGALQCHKTLLVVAGCLLLMSSHPATASIGDAVDSPALPWTTGGDAEWFSQTTTTHDGVDAAASGTITNYQVSSLQTTVTGPGVLVFWWKVSSEEGYDYLKFYTNGVIYTNATTLQEASISGETNTNWQRWVVEVPAASRILRWSYEKDESFDVGEDRGWLDQVSFYTNNTPPIIPVEPDPTITAGQEGSVTLSVRVLGTDPVSYQWKRFGTNLASGSRFSGIQSNTLTISPLKASDIGPYTLYASNAHGTVLSQPIMLMTFDQVLDTSALQWTYGGDAKWQGQTNVTHDGVDAAVSGLIQDNQVSWIRTSLFGPGTLSFWWKVDSEIGAPLSGDGLGFYLDGKTNKFLSGPGMDWTNHVVSLTEGLHTLEWRYMKDSEVVTGLDRGWLDQVTFISSGPLPFSVSPAGFSGGSFQITLQGQPGRVYRLYSSSNLLEWVPVQTNSDPSGLVPFSDASAAGRARSFYRAETDAN